LDVKEEGARTLPLSIDPLAALAESQEALHERLKEVAPTPPPELLAAWQSEAEKAMNKFTRPDADKALEIKEQFLVLITCRDEGSPGGAAGTVQGEGVECKALVR
jgi:hypothetical protein